MIKKHGGKFINITNRPYILQNQRTSTASIQEVLQTQAIIFDGFDESVENFETYSLKRLENFFRLRGLHKTDKETSAFINFF